MTSAQLTLDQRKERCATAKQVLAEKSAQLAEVNRKYGYADFAGQLEELREDLGTLNRAVVNEDDGTVTFSDDGTMQWSGGSSGKWKQVGYVVTLDWTSPPGKDNMVLTADFNQMDGNNQNGWRVLGKRNKKPE